MKSWIFNFIPVLLTFLFTLVLVSKVLKEGRAPGNTIAWLLIIILMPYLGIPLYLLVGDRKVKRIAGNKIPLYPSSKMPGVTHGNSFMPLPTGEIAFAHIMDSIQNARRSIHIATYIFGNDKVGGAILEALCNQARKGIEVKLLLDGAGSFWFPRKKLKLLVAAGGKYAVFVPLFRIPFSGHSNLRNHRKMVLVDDKEAILGGMNISSNYMGGCPDAKMWLDFSFSITGEALADFEKIFNADWVFAAGMSSNHSKACGSASRQSDIKINQLVPIRVIASGPDVAGDPLYNLLLTKIYAAKSRIWIASPYFIPDESLTRSLELACRRGVEVMILLPLHSDHRIVDWCRTSYLRQIYLAGGKIRFVVSRMMHAKMTLIDDSFALIGSANLDMRSLFYNYEVGVVLSSECEVQSIASRFDTIQREARPGGFKDYRGADLVEGVGRVIGPLL
ncbi:MAG: hypothetical protein A2583_14020 [Bdellovibrionales bacterium RIFOXYD1_FULL_53_11]|nr:MAG: hypothetical protein A2583_14020 [Bdellovibrionales bacterium RIFOXYD1_FULL_53_11]